MSMIICRCLAAMLAGLAVPAAAQDAQSLVAKNLEARGGAAAIAAINNVTFEGRTIFPGGFEVTYKETRARLPSGSADRVDTGVQGLDIVSAYDGHGGWKINPLQGRKDPEKMSADEARSLADEALLEGPLLAARSDGSNVIYLGREDFDGTLAYKLKVTQKDGDQFTYWLDPDTYLEIKIDETRRIRGAEQTSEAELGDYEKVAGVYFPMSIESWSEGQSAYRTRTIIATGAANGPVSASLFAEPGGSSGAVAAATSPPDAPDKKTNQAKRNTKSPPASPPSNPPKGK